MSSASLSSGKFHEDLQNMQGFIIGLKPWLSPVVVPDLNVETKEMRDLH